MEAKRMPEQLAIKSETLCEIYRQMSRIH